MAHALSSVLALLLAPALAVSAFAYAAHEGGPSSLWLEVRPNRPAEEATAEAILGNCFLAGTLVSMADGTKRPIEEVRVGDRVKAMDPKDGQVVDREVVRTFRNVTDTVVDVTWAPLDRVECMAVGPHGSGEHHSVGVVRSVSGESREDGEPPSADEAQTVRCTLGHPWWVESQQRWVLAGNLRVGDDLRLQSGGRARVLATSRQQQAATTFNFEVEDTHSYFVGTAGSGQDGTGPAVLVHNMSIWNAAKAARRARRIEQGARAAGARTYRNVELVDARGAPIGELDVVRGRKIIEHKNASGVFTPNPTTGRPHQTPTQWAVKQILEKTERRIVALRDAVGTRAAHGGSHAVPALDGVQGIRHIHFQVEGTDAAIRSAVGVQIQALQAAYPAWRFTAGFGGP